MKVVLGPVSFKLSLKSLVILTSCHCECYYVLFRNAVAPNLKQVLPLGLIKQMNDISKDHVVNKFG